MNSNPKTPAAMRSFKCPICGGNMRVKSTRMESELLRTSWLLCQNVHCAAAYHATTSLDYLTSPSGLANNLKLPLRQAARAAKETAQ